MYKIKEKPEDFFVKEISSVNAGKDGGYAYFTLRKRNYTTIRALQQIAACLNLPLKSMGFAGTKDKNAVTEQSASAKGIGRDALERISLKDIEIKFLGRGSSPISLGDLEGNFFRIIVRECDSEPKPLARFKNYFGEQRFSKNNAEIGKAIIKKDFRSAVQLVMENTGDAEKTVAEHLSKKPNDFVGALRKIPSKILKMYVHAYQSMLWNRIAEKSDDEEIPLIGFGTELTDEVKGILKGEGITLRDFIIKEIPELSSEGGSRKVFAEAKDLKIKMIDKKTIELEFFLSKGCYATEFIRQLLQEP